MFKTLEALQGDLGPGLVLIKGSPFLRLDRITFMLAGRNVRCHIHTCTTKTASCYHCPMLERGWDRLPVVG